MKKHIIAVLILIFAFAACASAATLAPVHVLNVDGQIDPAVADYIREGIIDAEDESAQAVLIKLNTPGGLVDSTRRIIDAFFDAKVPIVVYVSPKLAWAGSAGTFITMGADIAAMAPGSSIGAATPIEVSPTGQAPQPEQEDKDKSGESQTARERKQVNFITQYARSIAERRGRNADWIEKAVRNAESINAEKALEINVIDYIAEDDRDLMQKIDGKSIKLESGKTVVLRTAEAPLEQRPMGLWDKFLHFLSNPLVALFLSLAAMYGIIYELSSPGAIFPGVVGGIALLLLLYSFSVIPVNTLGLALVGFAVVLFIIDIFTPTHGVLTAGGVVSLFLGLMMLFRSVEGFMVSVWILALVALLTGGFFAFVVGLGIRALKNPYIAGREGVVGHIGEVRSDLNPTGQIFVDGALWTATSESGEIAKGEKVLVTEMTGLRLKVKKAETADGTVQQ